MFFLQVYGSSNYISWSRNPFLQLWGRLAAFIADTFPHSGRIRLAPSAAMIARRLMCVLSLDELSIWRAVSLPPPVFFAIRI